MTPRESITKIDMERDKGGFGSPFLNSRGERISNFKSNG